MGTETITLEVSSDSLVDEILRLITDDELTDHHKSLIGEAIALEEKTISDLSDSEICEQLMDNSAYVELDRNDVLKICDHFNIELASGEHADETIRDQQYSEVLGQLRDKFSIQELESFLNSK